MTEIIPATLFDTQVTSISGVGLKVAALLDKLELRNLYDLVHHYPHRYIDLSTRKKISAARVGEEVTVIGRITEVSLLPPRKGKPAVVSAGIHDGTGYLAGCWFNQAYLSQTLKKDQYLALSGKVAFSYGKYQIENPFWELFEEKQEIERSLHTGRIIPVHPATRGMSTRQMRRLVHNGLCFASERQMLTDHLPAPLRELRGLPELSRALHDIHFPADSAALELARRRLRYDELFLFQLLIAERRMQARLRPGIPHTGAGALIKKMIDGLPFKLTGAQQRAIAEIQADMADCKPMNRLLQGDVGSGKTVVALAALLTATECGYQGAMMAPTETLAAQHYNKLAPLLNELQITNALLTGNTPAAERKGIISALATGDISVVFGTHALIQSDVRFSSLSIAIIDEQHRFGVKQRTALRDKGGSASAKAGRRGDPDLLVMTATPIPRTLALTMYGDLNVSTLDEMPPGRKPIKTRIISGDQRGTAYGLVRREVAAGRQSYIICPLVEESSKIEERAVLEEIDHLQNDVFSELRIRVLHGRMKPAEKKEAMDEFASGNCDILLSTTVVEVGIDVPNATVILIEGAHRFGIAQLHQLRGRVGRGEHASSCILLNESGGEEALRRLSAVAATEDGFRLAEEDLKLRGEGHLLGARQAGMSEFRLVELPKDIDLLRIARQDAFNHVKSSPRLSNEGDAVLVSLLSYRFNKTEEAN